MFVRATFRGGSKRYRRPLLSNSKSRATAEEPIPLTVCGLVLSFDSTSRVMAVPAIADGDTKDYALNQENEEYITRNGRVHEKVRKLELLTRQVASSYYDESRGLQ